MQEHMLKVLKLHTTTQIGIADIRPWRTPEGKGMEFIDFSWPYLIKFSTFGER